MCVTSGKQFNGQYECHQGHDTIAIAVRTVADTDYSISLSPGVS